MELARAQEYIEKHADDYGLSFFQVVFEMVDYQQMNALAAYGQSGRMKEEDWLRPPPVDQRQLFMGNTILRGQEPEVDPLLIE